MAPMTSSERSPDSLTFLISAPILAARLTMSACGMKLTVTLVLPMIVFSSLRSAGTKLRHAPVAGTTTESKNLVVVERSYSTAGFVRRQ
jgi:hypothetical protein